MNNTVKMFLIFAGGMGVGILATKTYFEKKYEDLYQEEVASVRKAFGEALDEASYDDLDEEPEQTETYKKIAQEYGKDKTPTELAANRREKDKYHKYEDISKKANSADYVKTPYVITLEQFSEEEDHFEKSTIYYYAQDDTLADEQEEIIVDVSGTVGDEALTLFTEEDNVVYVRNERIAVDYEIIAIDKSYKETVLGFVEEDEVPRHSGRGSDSDEE